MTEILAVDWVMQSPGGHGREKRGGFSYAGWLVPHRGDQMGDAQADARLDHAG